MKLDIQLDMQLGLKRMSLQQLADKTGLTKQTLSLIKNNKCGGIRFDTLERICNAMDIQPGDILVMMEDDDESI